MEPAQSASGSDVGPARSASATGSPAERARSASASAPADRYRPETGCAASAEGRGDSLIASAPPAERWLLIEHNGAWPRAALTALRRTPPTASGEATNPTASGEATNPTADDPIRAEPAPDDLAAEVARLCTAARCRPVLIRRHGRAAGTEPRRWMLVDSRPGHESIRQGHLPTDEHLLKVLSGADPGTPTTDPIYLVCTHGRHDACCAVRGRPAAAALAAAYPDRTWECSHIGGDRFAANLVFLPHSLFYGHVPPAEAVRLAQAYDEGHIVPAYYRGSGAHLPAVQAAQHFARTAGHSLSVNALHPVHLTEPTPNHWRISLAANSAENRTSPTGSAEAIAEADTAPVVDTAPEADAAAVVDTAPEADAAAVVDTAPEADAAAVAESPPPRASLLTSDAIGAVETTSREATTPADGSTNSTDGSSRAAESRPGDGGGLQIVVEVRARLVTIDGQMTCAARPPGQVRQFTLEGPVRVEPRDSTE
ncbi:Sucraseferredoxin family protein [Kribbella flavida DSM 17836]|uniref:Sucraseferredoxin family protein n=1 Tax=Kribbella flavida (strain DSM 17836 / JCM 10339 / NBRC 14399) TaxID=479435 RepID=D2PS18_KRIFD|nr:sucrase ferredoxin [Kribbella flavida]ADB29348.1 Sucraseferredoxin family protein [Kribbella flavida DSM 17836]